MFGVKISRMRYLVAFVLMNIATYADTDEISQKLIASQETVFSFKNERSKLFRGEILNGRYNAPDNIFSCKADSFGEDDYLIYEWLDGDCARVGFYSPAGDYKLASIVFIPGLEEKKSDPKAISGASERFKIKVFNFEEDCEGMTLLTNEMIGDEMHFLSVSFDKVPLLGKPGKYVSATKAYLVFLDKDYYVLLSNQKTRDPRRLYTPKMHVNRLKKELIAFKKSFQFSSTSDRIVGVVRKD